MTQEQIHNLFKQGYNQVNWKQFLGETFAKARLLANPETLIGIDTNVAKQALKLGHILLDENGIERQIAVYEVTLAKGIILERNRVGLRNLLRKYWKDIDAAFIVYQNTDSKKWRFTYVSELTGYDSEGEFVKIKTEPKRYTYVLGEDESTRTAAERFALIAKKANQATLDDVKEAFSVEKLSKAFFDEYKKHYDIFCNFMVSKPNIRQAIFNGDEKGIRDFNKKLLGRIVFLYFIQKKGWLGVPVASKWGEGNFNFIADLFNNCKNPDLFYSELLSKLFFDTLNSKRKDDLIELVKGQPCRIPYLNGGLFEEDDKKHRNLIFNAQLFKNLFDFFNQYNFTIYEDDPNDHTVAVDPEMLGHIFENLLEDNKDKGAYYTPKEIVHYMCQESLIEYLCTSLKIEDEAKEKEAITNFLKKKEIDAILKPEIKNINKALDDVKICDPAIGSGAFPMGLLLEIYTAKQTLHTFEYGNTTNFDASAVKLNIIQNSIYGVDIEKGAVDIARLRFWLSLIVDEEKPKALPNLDYKIVVGNSLVSKLGDDIIDIDWTLNETSHGLFGADLAIQKGELLKKISKEQKEFFNPDSDKKMLAIDIRNLKIDLLINQLQLMVTTNGIAQQPTGNGKAIAKQTERYLQTIGWKNSIKDLQKLKNKLELALHFFDWKLDFPEVMNEQVASNVGFDIVIGNPPYVSAPNMVKSNPQLRDGIINTKRYASLYQKWDLYIPFMELGLLLLKNKGIFSMIVPYPLTNQNYGMKLRELIINEYNLKEIVDLNGTKIFQNATVSNCIPFISKSIPNETCFVSNLNKHGKIERSFSQNLIDLVQDAKTLVWNLTSEKRETTRYAYMNVLGDYCYISAGMVINADEKTAKGEFTKDDLISESYDEIHCRKYIEAKDIERYKVKKIRYLEYNTKRCPDKLRRPTFRELYEKPKLMFNRLGNLMVYLDKETKLLHSDSMYSAVLWEDLEGVNNKSISASVKRYSNLQRKEMVELSKGIDLHYLLGILNSKYASILLTHLRAGDYHIYPEHIRNIPIPHLLIKKQKPFIVLVKKILDLKSEGKDTTALEQQIDNLVYKLYELTYDEVKVIDPEFSLTKKEYEAIKLE
ncbi:MAG: N-6 DNA methylase [Melioribacteraceae bacterium]|nr:N-6 DNA methylase [Melioribacteraceae bacterium]